MKEITIIGFGNFGKLAAKNLVKAGLDVTVTDVIDKSKEAEEIGARFATLEQALKNKIIVLAVPMENLEDMLNKIKDRLIPGTLVLDVCSLKMFACDLMNKMLPKDIEIIGTHPLFGPQSAPTSIKGMRIVLCKVRNKEKTFNKVKEFLEKLELRVFVVTPEEHDRQMAVSQALTHFIGQVVKKMNLQRVELSTKTFDDLMNIMDIIRNDTPALFNNMQTRNPFAKANREKFIDASIKLNTQLNETSGGQITWQEKHQKNC